MPASERPRPQPSELVLMSAMQSYFSFGMSTLCGIPAITLLETEDDWRSIRRRAEVFAEFDLADWARVLLPVLDQFVAAAAGRVDRVFWRSLYKMNNDSGGPYVTGWINVLFPYLEGRGRRNDHALTWSQGMDRPFEGITLENFPGGWSCVPLAWQYPGTSIPTRLLGGFVGIAQDPGTRAVKPAIGWAVQTAARSAQPT
ncbi:MAG TPA: DUF4419 domain-containing protein [Kofleriaceae bacterium]